MTDKDLGWVAGFLEGEGCFSGCGKKGKPVSLLRVVASQKDIESLLRLQRICGGGKIIKKVGGGYNSRCEIYEWRLNGRMAEALVKEILPLMSKRRQRKAKEIFDQLEAFRAHPLFWNKRRYLEVVA